jgi:hypothetical protein
MDYGNVVLRFNKIMDAVSLKRSIVLNAPGSGAKLDTNDISFFAGGDIVLLILRDSASEFTTIRWKVGQQYVIVVQASAKDINGNTLASEFRLSFIPEPFFRIKSSSPQPNASNVPPATSVSLTFNSPVDTSFFSRIQIAPTVVGGWRLSSGSTSSRIHFDHIDLSYNAQYEILIPPGTPDIFGNRLPQEFRLGFTTDVFRISSTTPAYGDSLFALDDRIRLSFSGSVDTATIRSAVRLIPPANLTLWVPSNVPTYVDLYPSTEFIADTAYTVAVDTSLHSFSGIRLPALYSFTFRTPPLRVIYHTPEAGRFGVSRRPTIYFVFNGKIDTSSVRPAFSITGGVVGTFNMLTYSSSDFTFVPSVPLQPTTLYTVTIGTSLRSKYGTRLKLPYTFSFTTGLQ